MPIKRPVCTSPAAKGSAASPITPPAKANSASTTYRRGTVGSAPIVAAGPTRSGFLGRAARRPDRVAREERRQQHGIDEGDLASQDERERIQGGGGEKADGDHATAVERDEPPPLGGPREQRDRRPADAQQQTVGSGHVRDRVRREGRVVPGLPGEHDVDGVFRQHRKQRDDDERERARDVALGRLGGPRHRERRGHDARVEQQGPEFDRGREEPESGQERRRGDQKDEGDRSERRGAGHLTWCFV